MPLDIYRGNFVAACKWCGGSGSRDIPAGPCDGCGGTGQKRECRRADCREFGCGGYGTCYADMREGQE